MTEYLIKFETPIVYVDGNQYEPVEFRIPKKGEHFIRDDGVVWIGTCDHYQPRIILRRKWTWPEWLGGWGFAMDKNGEVFWYGAKATKGDTIEWVGCASMPVDRIAKLCPTFTPPTITDWTKPVLNPNWKGKP